MLAVPAASSWLAAVVLTAVVVSWYVAAAEGYRRDGRGWVMPPRMFYTRPLQSMPPLVLFNSWCRRRSAIPVRPVYRDWAEWYPELRVLVREWASIRDEAMALVERGLASTIQGDTFFPARIAPRTWKKFYLEWYSGFLADAERACPRTVALLRGLPSVRLAMFSVLEPGSVIAPHAGPFAGALRFHLGLSCPPRDCRIRVDSETLAWRDGEGVLFDDTFLHEVRNDSDQSRIVLFLDLERKMKTARAQRVVSFVCEHLASLTTRANEATERRRAAP